MATDRHSIIWTEGGKFGKVAALCLEVAAPCTDGLRVENECASQVRRDLDYIYIFLSLINTILPLAMRSAGRELCRTVTCCSPRPRTPGTKRGRTHSAEAS